MKNKIKINIFSNLILQITTILSGFILPKIILTFFGSEVNGLISSVTQFLSYISLLEGGVSGVMMASLYKPLYEENMQKVSSIYKTMQRFYRKIAFSKKGIESDGFYLVCLFYFSRCYLSVDYQN